MRLGLWGARADGGGLAALTYEVCRHLHPDKTFIVDMKERGRGPCHPERYQWGEVTVNRGHNNDIPEEKVRRFADGLDVVYAAETSYREDTFDIFRRAGVRTVLHAMPELWRPKDSQPDAVWAPTSWMVDELIKVGRLPPSVRVVPVPVPTDTFTAVPERAGEVTRGCLLHLSAPAFHDRNGTELCNRALHQLTEAVKVIYSGGSVPPQFPVNRGGRRVETDILPGSTYDRRDAYPAGCGALLLPRRYGGLCLPMQEAAALGWPIVTLDLPPQQEWVHPDLLVEPTLGDQVKMVNGWFHVYQCNPRRLADAVDRLVRDRDLWAAARQASLVHAASISWDVWASRYRQLLEEVAAGPPSPGVYPPKLAAR